MNLFIRFILLVQMFNATVCLAESKSRLEVGAGPSIIEQGDDRLRPGAMFHLGAGDYFARLYSYGRKFGPVTESTFIVSANRRLPIYGLSWLTGAFGLVLMNERTLIKYSDGTSGTDYSSTNFGASFSLMAKAEAIAPIYLEFGWASHVFLAGPNGGLFLATGRKQAISLGIGANL